MPEWQRADAGARRQALWLLAGGAIVGMVLILTATAGSQRLARWVANDPVGARARAPLIGGLLTAALGLPLLVAAVHCWRLGARVVAASRFPPPGMRVIRDTRVETGASARRQGRWLQVVAIACAAAIVSIGWMTWRLMILLGSGA